MPHSHPEREEKREADTLLKGLITGAILGAGILWLMGTDTGKKLKKEIEKEGKDLLDFGKDKLDETFDDDEPDEVTPLPLVPIAQEVKKVVSKKAASPNPTTSRRFFRRKR